MIQDTVRPAARVRELSRRFGKRWALRDVSLEVLPGQVHVLLGHNGAGKTTLFRALLGLIRPTAGNAELFGFNAWKAGDGIRARRNTGALFESNGLYDDLSAMENLELFAKIYRLDRTEWRERVDSLLVGVDLFDRRHEKVTRWSAGMKRKLALVRALQHNPGLAILDEPTAGLDAVSRAKIREVVREFRSMSSAVIIASQDLAEAEKVATHVTLLRQGVVMYTGTYVGLCSQALLRRFHGSAQAVSEMLRTLPSGMELVREDEDSMGKAVVVRTIPSSEFDADGFKGLVETPVSLEDVYLEMAHSSGS